MSNKPERFIYRYKFNYIPKFNHVLELKNKYFANDNNPSFNDKTDFCLAIKYAYEYAWKSMKDYLLMQGITELLPRKIIEKMGNYIDNEHWINLLNDIYLFFSDRKNENVINKFIDNYFNYYETIFDKYLHFISTAEISIEIIKNNEKTEKSSNFIHKNHCILDSYSFYELINYFKNNHKIEKVIVHGSRATNNFRLASDIDLFISGKYTELEYIKIEKDIENLNLPYTIDCCNIDAAIHNYPDANFVKESIQYSIPIYNKADFE